MCVEICCSLDCEEDCGEVVEVGDEGEEDEEGGAAEEVGADCAAVEGECGMIALTAAHTFTFHRRRMRAPRTHAIPRKLAFCHYVAPGKRMRRTERAPRE